MGIQGEVGQGSNNNVRDGHISNLDEEKGSQSVIAVREGVGSRRLKQCANKKNIPNFSEAEKGKKVASEDQTKGCQSVVVVGSNKKGKKTKKPRYNTRNKGAKKYEVVDEEESSDQGSYFYIDSDYDLDQGDDDVEFEENVSNPKIIEEYEEMGFKGFYSDVGGDTNELESWDGYETEEDEEGNPLPKKSSKKFKVKA